jgi:transposase
MTIHSDQPAQHKSKRRYTADFKANIIALSQQPQSSVAKVALAHHINVSLIHNWIKKAQPSEPLIPLTSSKPAFISLPISQDLPTAPASTPTFTLTLARETGAIHIHWPIDQAMQSIPWIKALGV